MNEYETGLEKPYAPSEEWIACSSGAEENMAEEFDGGGEVFGGHAVEATVGGEEAVVGEDAEVGVEDLP